MGKTHLAMFNAGGVRHATINGHRFHLRLAGDANVGVDTPRQHLLWVDGQQPPLILDDTAARFMAHLIDAMWKYQQGDGDQSASVIQHVVDHVYREYGHPLALGRHRVTKKRIETDLHQFFAMLMQVAQGGCPAEMGLPAMPLQHASWTAPARMDLAITYRCNLRCPKCYLPDINTIPELPTNAWKTILDTLWRIGIPQVVFTGGEPTLRDDLIDLIDTASHFVTGLVTNGTKLRELAVPLREASLDYAQVTVESADPDIHDHLTTVIGSHELTTAGIIAAHAAGLQVVTNTTLTKENAPGFVQTIRWLHGLGIRNIACNTLICSGRGVRYKEEQGLPDDELQAILQAACAAASELDVVLQWYSPTCYSQGINPLELGFGAKSCSAAAHNMTIQPDGSVLPCQSWPETVGNILTDDWPAIWKHPICRNLRERAQVPEACHDCVYVHSCGGGCPLDRSSRRPTGKEEGV